MTPAQAPLRIVIEGPNYVGKSSVVNQLHLLLPGATVIQLHDFCHQHIIRRSHPPMRLVSRDDYRAVQVDVVKESCDYLHSRTQQVLQMIDALTSDNIIIERLCVTECVYSTLLFGINGSEQLESTDAELAKRNGFLILLNADPRVLISRTMTCAPKTPGIQGYGIPYHLTDHEWIGEKCRLYNEAFRQMVMTPKVHIDTTHLSHEQVNVEIRHAIEKAMSRHERT